MKRTLLLSLAALLAVTGIASAQGVVGSAHDLSAGSPGGTTDVVRVCVFCHTPHQAATANFQYPLWNHSLSSQASYTVYSSITLNATPVNPGNAVAGSATITQLCLSCHDGTVSVASLYNPPNEQTTITVTAGGNLLGTGLLTGTPNMGIDLSNDHPVNFSYTAALSAADGELEDPANVGAEYIPNNEVSCASCHDPHSREFSNSGPFMIADNTDSAICTECHLK